MCHSREPRTPCAPLQLKLSPQGGHFLKEVEFLQVLWVLLIQLTHKRKAMKALSLSN